MFPSIDSPGRLGYIVPNQEAEEDPHAPLLRTLFPPFLPS